MHNVHVNYLAEYRALKGLSQSELGEMIGRDQATIQRAETEHKSAKLETYKKCADALKISVAQIFSEEPTEIKRDLMAAIDQVPQDRSEEVLAILKMVANRTDA